MKRNIIYLLAIVLFFTTCKKDEVAPKEKPIIGKEIIIGDNTKVLKLEDREGIVDIDLDNFNFTATPSGFFNSIDVNDIIVDSTSSKSPYGYMRKVTSIENNGGQLIIHTEQAKLVEAIKQASFSLKTNGLKNSDIQSIVLEPGVTISKKSTNKFRAFEFNFDKRFGTPENGVYVSGDTYLDIDFFWDFEWSVTTDSPFFEVDLLKSGVEVDQGASINVVGNGSYSETTSFKFAAIEFTPITIMVGPVPLVFVPKVEFFINMKGEISANITTGASETFNTKLGIKYENSEWSPIFEKNFDYDFIIPSIEANALIEASVEPRAGIFLYGIAGPVVGIEAYTNLNSELLSADRFNINYSLGIRSYAGVVLTVFGMDVVNKELELFDFPKSLYEIENGSNEESISIISPSDNAAIGVGETTEIKAYFTGQVPSKVEFYVNDNLVGSDQEKPFSFQWETNGLQTGTYQLKVKSILSNHELESKVVNVDLVSAGWDVYNLNEKISGLPAYMGLKDIFILDDSHIWINGDSGNIFFSSNAGDSWGRINSSGKVESSPIFIDSNNGYAFDTSYDLVYTNDGGVTWNEDAHISGFLGEEIVVNYSESSNLIMYGRLSGEEALTFYNSNQDVEETFVKFSDHNVSTSYQDGFVPRPKMISNSKGLFIPNMKYNSSTKRYLGLYKGGQFNLIDVGLKDDDIIVDLFFINETDGWFVSSLNLLYKTSDGGNNWEQIFNGSNILGGYEVKMFFVDPNTGYWIDTYSGVNKTKLYMTNDGGHNWSEVDGFKNVIGLNDVKFYGKNLGFVIGGGNGTYTDDGNYKIYRYHKGV